MPMSRSTKSAPTALSLQILHPYLCALDTELRKHFEAYQKSVEPENLKVELVVDRYLPSGGRVDVQLEVSNEPGASPVSNVVLTVLPSDDYTATEATIAVAESIGAGESKTCQISLVAGKPTIEQELITLVSRIGFTLRSQRRVEAEVEPKSIRLHTDTKWTEIPTRTAPVCRGEPGHVHGPRPADRQPGGDGDGPPPGQRHRLRPRNAPESRRCSSTSRS